jgi:hypothetical protein
VGAEEFQVTLKSQLSRERITQWLRKDGSFRELHLLGAQREHFMCEDDLHIIELEISDETGLGRIGIRFALCQVDSADTAYRQLVIRLARELGALVVINDEVEPGDLWEFSPNNLDEIADVLDRAIRAKRALWIADFGDERAKVTCADAVERFIARRQSPDVD